METFVWFALIWLQSSAGAHHVPTVIVDSVVIKVSDVGDPVYDELVIQLNITVQNSGPAALRLGKEPVFVTAVDKRSDGGEWRRIATPFNAVVGDLKYARCVVVPPGGKFDPLTFSALVFLEKSAKKNWPSVVRFGLRDSCQDEKGAISTSMVTGPVDLRVADPPDPARDVKK